MCGQKTGNTISSWKAESPVEGKMKSGTNNVPGFGLVVTAVQRFVRAFDEYLAPLH
jgi:hypothetical protein